MSEASIVAPRIDLARWWGFFVPAYGRGMKKQLAYAGNNKLNGLWMLEPFSGMSAMRLTITLRNLGWTLLVVAGLGFASGCGKTSDTAKTDVFTVAAANASNPTIALDPKAAMIYVAYIGKAGEERNVYLARMRPGEDKFSAPVQVNDIAGDAAAHSEAPAQVVAGPEGNIYVLWHKDTFQEGRRFPTSNLRFARSTDGGKTFAPAIFVNDDYAGPPTSHGFHSIAVAPDGTIYVAWLDGRDKAIAPAVMVARSTNGGQSFDPGVIVAHKICPCCRTALTVDAQGTLYVVFRNVYPENLRDMAIARSQDGGQTFSTPTRIHEDGWVIDGCPHNGPAIATDADGNVHLAWYTGKEEGYGVYYAVSSDRGDSFTPPLHLNNGMEASPVRATLVAQNKTAALLACEATTGTGSQIYLLAPDLARPGQFRRDSLSTGVYPVMAQQNGLIAIAWLDGDAVRATVRNLLLGSKS